MHLVLGHPEDSCCSALMERLAARGLAARLIEAPLEAPSRHSLRIDPDGRTSKMLAFDEGPAELIESVFVRSRGAIDPSGWEPADYAYMQAENQAVMLAWLSALDCPVVNRLNAELWCRARTSLLHWQGLLRRCGLRIPETIVTDSAEILADFRGRLEADGVPGAVFTSLSRDNAWLVGPTEWRGVEVLQTRGPVCLTEPHGPVSLLCIVGRQILWGGHPSEAERALSDQLVTFAQATDLDFVEIALGQVRAGPAVVHVDPLPRLEHFGDEAQHRIIDALTDLLTGCTAGTQLEMQS